MNHPYLILAVCPLFCFHSLRGAETDSVSIRSNAIYANPAVRFFEHTRTVSEIKLSEDLARKGSAYLMQTGKDSDSWQVKARSWIPLSEHTRLWGKASYRRSQRKSVRWNETSDFELLYPYVMADSVGGNLHGQRYDFSGGYAGKKKRFTWGIQMDYRAEIEYRNIDPRPRNVISDLNINAGGTFRTHGNCHIGLSAGLRSYYQNNDVDFYSSLGKAFIHTMTGLGNSYARFTGTRTSVDYKGNGYTAALQFFSEGRYGWHASGNYTHLSTVRHLKNDDNIPLTEMNDNRLHLSVSWLHPLRKRNSIGIGLQMLLTDRKGTENFFDSGNGTSYEKISSRQPYADKRENYGIALLYEPYTTGRMQAHFRPYYTVDHFRTTHIDHNRRMEITRSNIGAEIELGMPVRHSRWTLLLNGAYQPSDSPGLSLEGMAPGAMREMYEHNFETLSANRTIIAMFLRGTFPCRPQMALYGETGWETEIYRHTGNSHRLKISIGILF